MTPDLFFVAPDLPDLETLLDGLPGHHELVLLDSDGGLLEQISEVVSKRSGLSGVHILTHGQSGELSLGSERVTLETLDQLESRLRGWSQALSQDADILIYGCEAGSGTLGTKFIARLAELTGADVAASDDATGNRLKGGDWHLEKQTGPIESGLAVNDSVRRTYRGLLPITIDAAGVTNEEQMLLQIDGVTVATFDNVGGDAYGGSFVTYNVDIDGADIASIRIVFTNDQNDPVTGDRNLRVDKVTLDGVTYQTEAPTVFSTGTWLPTDGVVPGFRESEYLHTDGFFQFGDPAGGGGDGSVINIVARGTEGDENIELRIDGVAVQSWNAIGTNDQLLTFNASSIVAASQIQVAFTNDLWDPVAGIDRNVIVDSIQIDGEVFQTEHPSVYSTGTWKPEDGFTPGFRESEFLHGEGHFQYADLTPNTGSDVVVYASGFEGSENMTLQIDGVSVASWSSVGLVTAPFTYTAADVVTADQIRVAFTNDAWNPAAGLDRNLVVERITIDGVEYLTDAPTVYSTGSWLPADGIQPGFRQSDILNTNGYFQYDGDPGIVSLSQTTIDVNESELSVTLTINRSGDDGEVSFDLATIDGTATSSEDYQSLATNLTFLDGETTTQITLNLLPDTVDENDETFTVAISGVTGDATLGNASTVITIIDDDLTQLPGELSISPAFVVVDESSGIASFQVVRTGGSDGIVTVSFSTTDLSANAGTDYQSASGVLTFADGELTRTIDINVIDDAEDEPLESFAVTLLTPTGGATIDAAAASATIIDDDQATFGGMPVYQYEGRLYRLTTGPLTWNDAQAEAVALGGNLVTVNDAAEEAFLVSTFGPAPFWIGLHDAETEGTFQWANGEQAAYRNWGSGQPDDASGQDFVEMNSADGLWNDRPDAAVNIGIIEIAYTAGTEPTVPNGSGFETEVIASGLVQPIAFAEAPDGRIFVAEKAGVVRVIENGQVLATPFLDIRDEVNSHHDRGLMGIAIDPDFANTGHVYLQYAVELNPSDPDAPDFNSPAGGRLIRMTASIADANVADLSSRVVIQDGHQMSNATHAVGDVDFDNAGNLIFTWGDGGFDNQLRLSSQDPTSPQGKLFRIDRFTFEGVAGNPFYDAADPSGIASRVWAVGIRNSWKLTVDRVTGDVYMGEVTDQGPEEINVMRADGSTILNYGWPYYEDTNRTSYGTVPANFTYETAFIALPHTESGGGDAIVGGTVWRGNVYPSIYDGRYLFGNFNQGILYSADATGNFQQFGDSGQFAGAVDIQVGSDGHIWIMSLFTGRLERLVYSQVGSENTAPDAIASVTSTAGATPLLVTLDANSSVDADGDALSFAWDFESDGIVDATGAVVTHLYDNIGRTSTTLVVTDGRGGSDWQVIELDVLATTPTDGNLALGRPAAQSSPPDGNAIASRAVDGNTNGAFSSDSVAQTTRTRTPLWEIDLGAVYDLGSLEIYTRTDGVNPLNNYWILVSETPFSSGNLDAARNDPGVWLFNDSGTAAPLETIALGTLGRYVRIQMAGTDDVLALAEVKIFAS